MANLNADIRIISLSLLGNSRMAQTNTSTYTVVTNLALFARHDQRCLYLLGISPLVYWKSCINAETWTKNGPFGTIKSIAHVLCAKSTIPCSKSFIYARFISPSDQIEIDSLGCLAWLVGTTTTGVLKSPFRIKPTQF